MSEAIRETKGRAGKEQEGAEARRDSKELESKNAESKKPESARGAQRKVLEQDSMGLDFRQDSRWDSKQAATQGAQGAEDLALPSEGGGGLGYKSQAEIESIKSCVLGESPFAYTLSLISGKYKMSILYALYRFEVVRYNELKRFLETISFKSLTNTLRELESDGLILRKEYPQIPPRVEYSLSEKGRSLIPILNALCTWGQEHRGS